MGSKRERPAREAEPAKIPMTPMIDVVFQLLIYFLVTFEPVDVFAHLDVFAPSPESKQEKPDTPPNLIKVDIYDGGFMINDKRVSFEQLDEFLAKLAALDPNQTILIRATASSLHRNLIEVLDSCVKSGLKSLSVISTN